MEREKLKEVHQLADTTFRNAEEFMEYMNSMVIAARAYHKSLQVMAETSDNFFKLMESVGAKASMLPGAVRKLGDCMLEMVASHRDIRENQEDWMQSLNTDFIIPMELKLKDEKNNLITDHQVYKKESLKRVSRVKKTQKKVKKAKKKRNPSRAQVEKHLQLDNRLTEDTDMMRSTCVEGLRKALIEERRLYCFCIDHFCSVLQNQISYNAASHHSLSTRVNNWSTLCSLPDELPPESAFLLTDPRSARAFPPSSLNGSRALGSMLAEVLQMENTPIKPRQRRMSCRVRALYPHHNTAGDQLEFNPGDLIDAIDEPQDGWQYGSNARTGNAGWFPVQYVNKIWPSPNPSGQPNQPPSIGNSFSLATERDQHHQDGSRRSSQTSSIVPSIR